MREVDNHIEDGWIVLDDAPGLGIRFDEDTLRAAEVARPTAAMQASASGRRRGAGLCIVPPGEPEEVGQE